MTITSDTGMLGATGSYTSESPLVLESPFAEAPAPVEVEGLGSADGLIPWTEQFSPFAEAGFPGVGGGRSEHDELLAELYESLGDEAFDEALVGLVTETAEAADERLVGESASALGAERWQLAEAHLAPLAFEAERYLERLDEGLSGVDLGPISEQELEELVERHTPHGLDLTPAGEEFIGGLIRKAKKVVKGVAKATGKAVQAVSKLPILGPILKRLKALIRPLLRQVLAVAINRLPAPLRQPARALAARFGVGEAEADVAAEGEAATPVTVIDPESLAESFDAALAESIITAEALAEQGETFGYELSEDESGPDGTQLEALAEARAELLQQISSAQAPSDLEPAIEQFLPAVLPALRLGIRLVGRPKVVSFLAKYLAELISHWVGPQLAGPLANAVVDVGLRIISLEHPEGQGESETAPAVLAATIEDTVRRLTEQEDYVFEDENLLQLAVSDAFEHAVADNFPTQLVRPDLQLAPTLGGSWVPRHPRQVFAYKKYNRAPEVEITPAMAEALRTFGGATLAAAISAQGRRLPLRARLHLYETTAGTALARVARLEKLPGLGSGPQAWNQFHLLSPEAAGILLREPKLGRAVPARFQKSRHRLAIGQRVYYLEPLSGAVAAVPRRPTGAPTTPTCQEPSTGGAKIDLIRSEVAVALYFSEADAQAISASITGGRGGPALLKALVAAYEGASRGLDQPGSGLRIVKEYEEGEEFLGPLVRRLAPIVLDLLRRKLREWVLTTLASWVRSRSQEFARAAQQSPCGVTVTVALKGVPGLAVVRQALNGQLANPASLNPSALFRGTPSTSVTVVAGRHLP